MTVDPKPTCRIFRGGDSYRGKQGFDYANGISAETAGSSGICMVLLTIAPGDRAKAHLSRVLAERAAALQRIAAERYADVVRSLSASGFQAVRFEREPGNDYYFRQQIVHVARQSGYYANLQGPKHWVHLRIGHGVTFHAVVAIHHWTMSPDLVECSNR